MIKVANIIMDGRFAGAQGRIAAVAKSLKEHGIETIVVLPQKNSEYFRRKLSDNRVEARALPLDCLSKQPLPLLRYFIFFIPQVIAILDTLKKDEVDIVHCNGSWQFKGVIAAKLAKKKVVWHLNDTYMPRPIKFIFNLLASHCCDTFITAGQRVHNYYLLNRSLARKPNITIQAPVDTILFDPIKVKGDSRISRSNGIKIGTIANLNPTKGLEYFIQAASILERKYQGLHFFAVGPEFESQKKYVEKLRDLTKNLKVKSLDFCGFSEDIASILKGIDIYLFCSNSEASPISVWEAMAMGKAIITTDVGDVARFIKDGVNGFVVSVKDVRSMVKKASFVIEHDKLRAKIGKRARETAIKYFDLEVCVRKHSKCYRELMLL